MAATGSARRRNPLDRNPCSSTVLDSPRVSAKSPPVTPVQVLTLTPFYPTDLDDAAGCFVAEPLAALAKAGVVSTVFALQPFYREKLRASGSAAPAKWFRYFSLPGGIGLPAAGAFAFARIVGHVRELQRSQN